jgi:adenylosuccinate lyase
MRSDPAFELVDFEEVLRQGRVVGRAPQQVDEFLEQEVGPIRAGYRNLLAQNADVSI